MRSSSLSLLTVVAATLVVAASSFDTPSAEITLQQAQSHHDKDAKGSCARCGLMVGCSRDVFGDGMCSNLDITDFEFNTSYASVMVNDITKVFAKPTLRCCVIYELDFSLNSITKIVKGALKLPILRILNLNNNLITFIETGSFDAIPLITSIDLSQNLIMKMAYSTFASANMLTSLYMYSNALVCSVDNSTGLARPSCNSCVDDSNNPTLLIGSYDHEYQQCYPITHAQVLIAILCFELIMFYVCHKTCLKPRLHEPETEYGTGMLKVQPIFVHNEKFICVSEDDDRMILV